jgi:hypothetical protein
MTAIGRYQLAIDSTDTLLVYTPILDSFFSLEDPAKIPFYDTPQGAIFRGFNHKEVQIKRRILEYQAEY